MTDKEAYTSQIDELAMALAHADAMIGELEAENARLRSVLEDYAAGYPSPDKADEALETT